MRIFRFVTEKSIEEVMLARAKSKLDMDGKVIQAGRFDNKSTAEEQEEYLVSISNSIFVVTGILIEDFLNG